MNVTGVPAHTGFSEAAIDTLTGRLGITAMEMVLDNALRPVVQSALEEIAQVIVLLFCGT